MRETESEIYDYDSLRHIYCKEKYELNKTLN